MPPRVDMERTVGIDEYARLPDDGYRTELVRGLVVREPQPGLRHGDIQARLAAILIRHIDEQRLDLACLGPTGFVLERDPPTVRGPDLAILRRTRFPAPDHPGFVEGAPEMVIEIASPSNSASAIRARLTDFFRAGARLAWVVYPETRTVAVHESPSRVRSVALADELDGGDVVPGLRIRVSTIFRT